MFFINLRKKPYLNASFFVVDVFMYCLLSLKLGFFAILKLNFINCYVGVPCLVLLKVNFKKYLVRSHQS